MFENLSKYVFTNLFQPAFYNFDSNLDEVYCILFTCIVLSDINFIHVTSKALNGSIILYFRSLFYTIVSDGNKARRILHNNKGLCVDESWSAINNFFGSHVKP